jgi:hypothetical protein
MGSPALADTLTQLDNLSRTSSDSETGIAFARNQIKSGDLLGAMATLERILIGHPESDEALLLHASLLCRLDDRTGSLIEFDYLRGQNIPQDVWTEATAPCDTDNMNSGSGS